MYRALTVPLALTLLLVACSPGSTGSDAPERPLQLVVATALVAVGTWDLTNNIPLLLG